MSATGIRQADRQPMDGSKAGEHPHVVLEATYGWYWAVNVLRDAGADVHLAHPLGVKGFAYRRIKKDVRDPSDLADLLRMGRLPEGWIAPPAVRELRELVRHRAKLDAKVPRRALPPLAAREQGATAMLQPLPMPAPQPAQNGAPCE